MRAHALVVGKGIKSNQKRHETQAKPVRRRGAGGRSHYRARKKCFWREKCCVTACGSYLYRVAGRTLQFALKAFYGASVPLLRGAYLAPAYAQPVCTVVCPGGVARPLRMYMRGGTLFVQCACAG